MIEITIYLNIGISQIQGFFLIVFIANQGKIDFPFPIDLVM